MDRALAVVGEEFFRVECLRPVAVARLEEIPAPTPYYELMGEQRATEGAVASVIRYQDHVAPLAAAIGRHAASRGGVSV